MTIATSDSILELYADFIRLRKIGYTGENAWEQVKQRVDGVSRNDVKRLMSLIAHWEKGEGRSFIPANRASQPPAEKTVTIRAIKTQAVAESVSLPARPARSSIIRPLSPRPATNQREGSEAKDQPVSLIRSLMEASKSKPRVVCGECGHSNSKDEITCLKCGCLLALSMEPPPDGSTAPVVPISSKTTELSANAVVYFSVRGAQKPLRITPQPVEVSIGRLDEGSVMVPDVDLTPFGAATQGVSRMHIGLRWENNTVVLTDLGSRNRTYLNGQHLHEHEVRVLRDGDEIRLGQMVIRVHFRPK